MCYITVRIKFKTGVGYYKYIQCVLGLVFILMDVFSSISFLFYSLVVNAGLNVHSGLTFP